MITTAVIAFREFLEALLIVGVFLGISRKMKLHREREICLAATIGIVLSLLLSIGTYFFGDNARNILSEKNADSLESYLLIFSGIFIAYVVFSLHNVMQKSRKNTMMQAHKKLQSNAFDLSLFFTIIFLVLREGFEIALFTAGVSLFSAFMQNFIGLLLGFGLAGIVGASTYFAFIKLPIGKVFKWTEYMIILLGAALVQNGVTKLFETHFNIHLSDMISMHLKFLPSTESIFGHVLQGLFGIDRGMSVVRVAIMLGYIGIIYVLFLLHKKLKLHFAKKKV